MPRPEKEAVVNEVAEILQGAQSVFLTDFQGLNVEEMIDFRRQCRKEAVGYRVVKNTLTRLAAKKAGMEELLEHIEGPSAIAYSYDDPSAPARVITSFAKTHERPVIKVSRFEGEFYGPDRVEMIASLPSKEVLLAKLLGSCNAPLQGFVGTLSGLLQKLVMTIDAVKNSRDE
jgi:large subunit ribosomal protein L10